MKNPNETVYTSTAVSLGGNAVLITGKSGRGKSDLALRLIDRGAILIADDKTVLRKTKPEYMHFRTTKQKACWKSGVSV